MYWKYLVEKNMNSFFVKINSLTTNGSLSFYRMKDVTYS